MIIHTTKKGIEQFANPLHEVDLAKQNGELEILNWTALPYSIHGHQGMVVLNDYTNFTVIISQKRPFKSFEEFFEVFSLNVMAVCEAINVSVEKVKAYLDDIHSDRKIIMQMSNHSKTAKLVSIYKKRLIENIDLIDRPVDLQNVMAALKIGRDFACELNGYHNPLAAFKFELTAEYLFPADQVNHQENIKIKPTWDPYSKWCKMDGKIGLSQDEIRIFKLEVHKNNSLMVSRFQRYLKGSVNKFKIPLMLSYARDYLDEFLLNILHQTFIHDLSILPAYFTEFMPAHRQNPMDEEVAFETLCELADFWQASGQISEEDQQFIKDEVQTTRSLVKVTFAQK